MEYSGKIDFWGLPDDEFMTHKTIDELIYDYLDANFGKAIPGEIIIYGYVKKEIDKDRLASWVIDALMDHMDEEYTVENGNTQPVVSAIRKAALKLVEAIIDNNYNVEALDKDCEMTIKISDYIEKEETIEKRD